MSDSIRVDARGAANMWMLMRGQGHRESDGDTLASLIEQYGMAGYKRGLEFAMDVYCDINDDECPQDDSCGCFMCRMRTEYDRTIDAIGD